eukprot:477536-Amphidinium_carterae.10
MGVNLISFADDLTFYADSEAQLRDALALIEEYRGDLGIKHNAAKTQYFQCHTDHSTFDFDGVTLKSVEVLKLFGHEIQFSDPDAGGSLLLDRQVEELELQNGRLMALNIPVGCRSAVLALLVVSKTLFHSWRCLHLGEGLDRWRLALLRYSMPTLTHGPRLKEAVLVLLRYGHLTDPCLRALVELLSMLRPMGVPVSAPAWAPTRALLHWLRGLQLTLKQGWLISTTTAAQLYVGPNAMPLKEWRHRLRKNSPLVAGRAAQAGSPGAEDMDVEAMLNSMRAMEPQKQKVLARGLIVDERLHRWQQRQRNIAPEEAADGICTHCNLGVP